MKNKKNLIKFKKAVFAAFTLAAVCLFSPLKADAKRNFTIQKQNGTVEITPRYKSEFNSLSDGSSWTDIRLLNDIYKLGLSKYPPEGQRFVAFKNNLEYRFHFTAKDVHLTNQLKPNDGRADCYVVLPKKAGSEKIDVIVDEDFVELSSPLYVHSYDNENLKYVGKKADLEEIADGVYLIKNVSAPKKSVNLNDYPVLEYNFSLTKKSELPSEEAFTVEILHFARKR